MEDSIDYFYLSHDMEEAQNRHKVLVLSWGPFPLSFLFLDVVMEGM